VDLTDDRKAIAAGLRQVSRSIAELAALLDGSVPSDDLYERQAAALREFDVPPERGLSRAEASAAFKKHGLDPRSSGSWIQGRYLTREGDRRWLAPKGREWMQAHEHVSQV
jgi:hypothetical protein